MSGTESVEPRPDRQVASDGRMSWQYRHTVLSLCMLAFLVTYFARLAISPVVPLIVDDFGVEHRDRGRALRDVAGVRAAQFPSGVLADRYGERRVIPRRRRRDDGDERRARARARVPRVRAGGGGVSGSSPGSTTRWRRRCSPGPSTTSGRRSGFTPWAGRSPGSWRPSPPRGSGSGTAGAPRSRWPLVWSARRCSCCSRGVSARLSPGVPTSRCGSGSRSRHSSNSSRARASSSRCSSRWSARTWCRA